MNFVCTLAVLLHAAIFFNLECVLQLCFDRSQRHLSNIAQAVVANCPGCLKIQLNSTSLGLSLGNLFCAVMYLHVQSG